MAPQMKIEHITKGYTDMTTFDMTFSSCCYENHIRDDKNSKIQDDNEHVDSTRFVRCPVFTFARIILAKHHM